MSKPNLSRNVDTILDHKLGHPAPEKVMYQYRYIDPNSLCPCGMKIGEKKLKYRQCCGRKR